MRPRLNRQAQLRPRFAHEPTGADVPLPDSLAPAPTFDGPHDLR
jgi:hypothetical protein